MESYTEKTMGVVRAFTIGTFSLVVVVPKTAKKILQITRGTYFLVKLDSKRRLIYEILPSNNLPTKLNVPSQPSKKERG